MVHFFDFFDQILIKKRDLVHFPDFFRPNLYFSPACYSRKKSDTPNTEISAPTTLRVVMGCLKSHHAGKMMMMGVSAMRVLAMPALVYCTASSEHPTPTKGPKIVVSTAAVMLLASVMFLRNELNPSRKSYLAQHQSHTLAHGSAHGKEHSIKGQVEH